MGLYVGGTKTNIARARRRWKLSRGVCGVKIFAGSSTGDLMIEDDEHLETVMRSGRRRIAYPQRGRIPPAGTQADVQVGRSAMPATWSGATRNAPSSAPAA